MLEFTPREFSIFLDRSETLINPGTQKRSKGSCLIHTSVAVGPLQSLNFFGLHIAMRFSIGLESAGDRPL